MWVTRRLHSFLSLLSTALSRMEDSASLRDALEACIFFAASMGRLGGDFTAMLAEIFEPKMASIVLAHWKEAVSTLQETLKVCRDAGVATPLTSSNITSTVAAPSLEQPPRQLLSFPPLARLVNMYLSGLNELRRCLLPGIFSALRKELIRSLSTVKALLETNQRAVNAPGLRGEATQLREVASNMLVIFDKTIEPYIKGALEVALGDYAAAKHFLKKELEEVKEDAVVEEVETEEIGDESVENNADGVINEESNVETPNSQDNIAEEVPKTPFEAVGESLAAQEAIGGDEEEPIISDGWEDNF
jgi:conserved oligomeric Golgi complex subunit 8